MLRIGLGAFEPRRIPEIKQHLGSGCEAVNGEVPCRGRAFTSESSALLESVDILDQVAGTVEVNKVVMEWVGQSSRSLYYRRKVLGRNIRCHVCGLEKTMNAMLGRVPMGIWPDPSVVLDRRVKGLRSVGDVVAQPSGIKDDGTLDGKRRLVRRLERTIFAKRRLQTAIDLHRDVGLKTDMLGKIVVSVIRGCRLFFIKSAIELVTALWQWIEPRDALQIDEVVRFLRVLQGELSRIAPAIRFGSKIGDLNCGLPQEQRHGRRNPLGRHAVNVGVSFAAPGKCEVPRKRDEYSQQNYDEATTKQFRYCGHSHVRRLLDGNLSECKIQRRWISSLAEHRKNRLSFNHGRGEAGNNHRLVRAMPLDAEGGIGSWFCLLPVPALCNGPDLS